VDRTKVVPTVLFLGFVTILGLVGRIPWWLVIFCFGAAIFFGLLNFVPRFNKRNTGSS
jgi:hypothetical protein